MNPEAQDLFRPEPGVIPDYDAERALEALQPIRRLQIISRVGLRTPLVATRKHLRDYQDRLYQVIRIAQQAAYNVWRREIDMQARSEYYSSEILKWVVVYVPKEIRRTPCLARREGCVKLWEGGYLSRALGSNLVLCRVCRETFEEEDWGLASVLPRHRTSTPPEPDPVDSESSSEEDWGYDDYDSENE